MSIGTIALLLATWTLLAAGHALIPLLGSHGAVLVSFALAAAVLLAARPDRLARPDRRSLAVAGLGLLAGFASYAAWVALVAVTGLAIGLDPPRRVRLTPPLQVFLSAGLAAPVFEEVLYRERLLGELKGSIGSPLALIGSAVCFALPHLAPWPVLGTFLVGLALGGAFLAGQSVLLCIALHAGLNLAHCVAGLRGHALVPAPLGAAAAITLFGLALRLQRRAC